MFIDTNKQPTESLTNITAFNVESLPLKVSALSKGIIDSVHQLLLKEWGPECHGTLPEGSVQEFLIEVFKFIQFFFNHSIPFIYVNSHISQFESLYSFWNQIQH